MPCATSKLNEHVRAAAGEETILITDRERVVAELSLPRAGRAQRLDDVRLTEAVRRGWISPLATYDAPMARIAQRLGFGLVDL